MSAPGELADPVPVRLPDPARLFTTRAARLRALAPAHATQDFLLLLARVADGQALAVREIRTSPARAAGGGPPLAAERVPRDGAWRRILEIVLAAARAPGLPAEAEETLRRLSGAGEAHLEEVARAVLAADVAGDQLADAPFVGAALQAWFVALAAGLDASRVGAGADACPVCDSPPVAGVVRASDRLRYLTCSLCASEWNVTRLQCTLCAKDAHLSYFHVEGAPGANAEACGACKAYVKLFDELKRPGAEPAADDAATLTLDLLLAEDGWRRAGANLYLATAAG